MGALFGSFLKHWGIFSVDLRSFSNKEYYSFYNKFVIEKTYSSSVSATGFELITPQLLVNIVNH